jgi:hypothetical protein
MTQAERSVIVFWRGNLAHFASAVWSLAASSLDPQCHGLQDVTPLFGGTLCLYRQVLVSVRTSDLITVLLPLNRVGVALVSYSVFI